MMSLIALPPIFVATRDGLQSVPAHMREAAFALGKTRITTIRRVLLAKRALEHRDRRHARRSAASSATRRSCCCCSGETLHLETQGSIPALNLLRGTGSTLTSYIYDNSPAGEGDAPQKAYAAAFVLLVACSR